MLISRSLSQLLLIDIQTRLALHVAGGKASWRAARVADMEAHVCLWRTALDLVTASLDVSLVADAQLAGWRGARSRVAAPQSPQRTHVSHEMVAFEWLGHGDTKEFKDLIEVIK